MGGTPRFSIVKISMLSLNNFWDCLVMMVLNILMAVLMEVFTTWKRMRINSSCPTGCSISDVSRTEIYVVYKFPANATRSTTVMRLCWIQEMLSTPGMERMHVLLKSKRL